MAQERKKRRIVLASVLKPVDDTRMLDKLAASLARHSYEVFVIGYGSGDSSQTLEGIHLIPIGSFHRLSVSRFLTGFRILKKVLGLKPDLFIFNTHELLWPAIMAKVLMPVRIVYDVRENYYLNIRYTNSLPWLLRWPVAMWVRWKEKLLAPAVDHFFLAEKSYEQELKFHRGGWTLLENKPVVPKSIHGLPIIPSGNVRLLFTGTLHGSTGVFDAIKLAKGLHALDDSVKLTIIGFASLKSTLDEIKIQIESSAFIQMIGGDKLVHHSQIMEAIGQADAGILSYPDSPHTRLSHPTKLFEYLAMGLPIILETRWPWIENYNYYKPFIFTDFENPDYQSLLVELKVKRTAPPIPGVTWEDEEGKLVEGVRVVLP